MFGPRLSGDAQNAGLGDAVMGVIRLDLSARNPA